MAFSMKLHHAFFALGFSASIIISTSGRAQEKSTDVPISSPLPRPDETAATEPKPPTATQTDLAAGSAKGSLTFHGATADLKFAAAFINPKDERKLVVVVLSDQKLPAEKWTSSSDIMMDETKWNGVVFFFDQEGEVFQTDVHMKGSQTSVSGFWDATIDNPKSKDVTGNVKTTNPMQKNILSATFHAVLK
jgi:hypothetical protein